MIKRMRITDTAPSLIEHNPHGLVKVITAQKDIKLLGITLQDNLTWSSHIENGTDALFPAAQKKLGVLKHLGSSMPMRSRKLLTEGLVISKLRYIIPIWGE